MSVKVDAMLAVGTGKSTAKASKKESVAEDFKNLLNERIDSLDETTKKMDKIKKELKQLKEQREVTEIIRRIMPDGSIQVTKYVEGKIESRYTQSPRMHWELDYASVPKLSESDGTLSPECATKLVAKRSIADDLLGMLG